MFEMLQQNLCSSVFTRGSNRGDGLRGSPKWLLGAMTALVVARPLFPSEAVADQGDGLPVVMLWLALCVCFMLGAIGRRDVRIRFGLTDAAVLILIALHTIAAVVAATHLSARPAVNMLWEWIAMGAMFFLARQLITTQREARAVVAVMIALAVGLSSYGLYQYAYEMPHSRAEYAADPDSAMRAAGLWYPPDSPQCELFENRLQSTEPIATFALTNSLAGYLAPWLVVAVGIMVCSSGSLRSRKRLICLIPIAACLLLTSSRSGCIATAFGLALIWFFRRNRNKPPGWKLPVVAVVLVSVIIAAAGMFNRQIFREASKSLGYRVQYWQSTMQMIAEHPLTGCGPGNFQHAYTKFKLPEASEEVADPHNFLLEVWATAGTPAMLAMLAVLGCFFYVMYLQFSASIKSPRTACGGTVPEYTDAGYVGPIYFGALCGFLLSVPLGLLSAAPPGVAAVIIGLPLAACCVALLSGWVDSGWLPAWVPAVGAAALLMNLLAAGGIGFPAVAGSLWLLMALGLNLAESDVPRLSQPWHAVVGLAVAVALAAGCYASAYGPVLRCQGAMHRAWRDPADARQHLAEAAAADPLSDRPQRQLAAIAMELWRVDHDAEQFERFEAYNTVALQRAPNSSGGWLTAGDWYYEAFAETGRREYIEKAVAAYRRAVQLYPNSGLHRAKLALALRAAGDRHGFHTEARAALRLDRLTPHADKKLSEELRNRIDEVENEFPIPNPQSLIPLVRLARPLLGCYC